MYFSNALSVVTEADNSLEIIRQTQVKLLSKHACLPLRFAVNTEVL